MLREGVADFGPYKKRLAKGKVLETGVVRRPVGVRETCSLGTQRVSFVFLFYGRRGENVLSLVYLIFYKI